MKEIVWFYYLKSKGEMVSYLEWTERASKTRTGGENQGFRAFPPKLYERPGSEKDPVALYLKFRAKRPESKCNDTDPFFLGK